MCVHTHLPAMVGFVRKHVAQHFQANRPGPSPAVSAKLLDAAPATAQRFREHLRAASGALGQSGTSPLRRAVRAVELSWNLQVRSGKPDPLAADIVHVREDRRNGADLAGRFGSPGGRVKMFDKNLVHAVIGCKDLDRGSAELSVNLGLTRGHGSLPLDLYYFRAIGLRSIHFLRRAEKRVEQLNYLHSNPVKRDLVEKPEDCECSSFRHYDSGVEGVVEIESPWTAWRRRQLAPTLSSATADDKDGAPTFKVR